MQDPQLHPPPIGCVAVVIPAAGCGRRFGNDRNKLFACLDGKPIWLHSASRLAARGEVGRIVMPISESDRPQFEDQFASQIARLGIELVTGGAQRTDSVRAGLEILEGDGNVGWVAIHDAARPLVSESDLAAVFATAFETGAAILATPVAATLKRELSGADHPARITTVDRRDLWIAQTPQVFSVALLKLAYQKHNGRQATDDAELVERIGHPVSLVQGSTSNLKITFPEDLILAESLLRIQREQKANS